MGVSTNPWWSLLLSPSLFHSLPFPSLPPFPLKLGGVVRKLGVLTPPPEGSVENSLLKLVTVVCDSECAETTPAKHACDNKAARRLWDESVRLVELSDDETHPLLR